jgi:hypothetical protein
MKYAVIAFSFATLTALSLTACKRDAGAPARPSAPSATPAAPPAPPAAAIVRANVGVAECDEWLRKVEACMARDPKIKERYEAGYRMMNEA